MLIEKTEEHIKNGIAEDECNCPIALAIQDAVEMGFDDDVDISQANIRVTVHDDDIRVHHHNNNAEMEFMFELSPKSKDEWKVINDFISRYDRGYDVEPFDMEFQVIQ